MNGDSDPLLSEIADIYCQAFARLDKEREPPSVDVRFYPYVGINHTIRIRNGRVLVRLAEVCHDMPLDAHRGLARILVGKLFSRKTPPAVRAAYEEYIRSVDVRERADESKRTRGRKVVTSAKGEIYDLEEIFAMLNFWYFGDRLTRPTLTWSPRKSYHILGHHDSTHDTISISRSLDSQAVPRFVVEFVLFHEMLHIAHPAKHVNGRRYHHTAAFRRDERRFSRFDEAERWIETNVGKLRRAARAENKLRSRNK
ncbi:MAG TPA: hypothetical protein VGJ02_09335 [Pyrinomonadaceae bacterium]